MTILPLGFGPRWFRRRRQARALDATGQRIQEALRSVFPELDQERQDKGPEAPGEEST